MFSRIWKGITQDGPKCGAEMKLGMQVFRGLRCQRPAGHEGRHQANALTSWGSSNVAKEGRAAGTIPPWPAPPKGPGVDDL